MGEFYPDWDCLRDIFLRVEGEIPFVKIHSSWTHKVRTIPEDRILILFLLKDKGKITFPTEDFLNLSLNEGSPVFIEPDINRTRRQPEPCEQAYEAFLTV